MYAANRQKKQSKGSTSRAQPAYCLWGSTELIPRPLLSKADQNPPSFVLRQKRHHVFAEVRQALACFQQQKMIGHLKNRISKMSQDALVDFSFGAKGVKIFCSHGNQRFNPWASCFTGHMISTRQPHCAVQYAIRLPPGIWSSAAGILHLGQNAIHFPPVRFPRLNSTIS